ncbi:hypothetical protein GIB67_030916 [Kingdonia uniflora]|uniref:Pentatricopeptide repeat-containing protein-mitochondrial domain-containing protein n=1 Tax=Kingdonia uniflora TaxID=39325 RepID=A0A7J7L3K5_9MAGN|nr:hypothetical protein GIB67_030916 [Kingdonia uniflora]
MLKQPIISYNCFNVQQYLSFSSKPDSLVELVSTSEWSDELEQELGQSHPSLDHETVIYVLKKLEKNPKKAYEFYNWVYGKNGFKHSIPVYSLVLRILSQKESLEDFWTLITKLSDAGHHIDKRTGWSIFADFSKQKLSNDAVKLNKMVEESSVDTTVKSVVEVILGSDWNDQVKSKLSDLELSLSDNSVLSILWELREYPSKALEFFRWVEEIQEYKHNAVTYNAIVWVFGFKLCIEEFWKLVKETKSAGYDIDMDTYAKALKVFINKKKMKDTVELYELMMDSPYKPPIEDCSYILGKISLHGTTDLSLADRVIKKFEEAGNTLSKSEYDMMHRSFSNLGKFDEANKIMETMKIAGYAPDNVTFNQIVYGLCRAGKFEEACNTLDVMETQGNVPDLKMRTTLIQGLSKTGEIDKALACLTKTQETYSDSVADLVKVLVN